MIIAKRSQGKNFLKSLINFTGNTPPRDLRNHWVIRSQKYTCIYGTTTACLAALCIAGFNIEPTGNQSVDQKVSILLIIIIPKLQFTKPLGVLSGRQ